MKLFRLHRQPTAAIATIFLVVGLATAQISQTIEPPKSIKPNELISGSLGGGETHRYSVTVKSGSFLRVKVEQKGVDVVVRLVDGSGTALNSVDSPNGKNGPETLDHVVANSGKYVIEIAALESTAAKGDYSVWVDKPRAATPADRQILRAKAESKRLFDEAEKISKNPDRAKRLEAVRLYREAASQYAAIPDDAGEGYALFSAGLVQSGLGDQRAAVALFEESLAPYSRLSEKGYYAVALTAAGRHRAALGDLETAIERFKSAVETYRVKSEKRLEADSLRELAAVYDIVGNKALAIEAHRRAVGLRNELKDVKGETDAIRRLGYALAEVGEVDKGVELLNQAKAMTFVSGDKKTRVAVLMDLASSMYFAAVQGNRPYVEADANRAIETLNEALVLAKELNERVLQMRILSQIGRNYSYTGYQDKALDHIRQAREIARTSGDLLNEGFLVEKIAGIYFAKDDWASSVSAYREALELFGKARSLYGEASAELSLGLVYYQLGAFDKSLEFSTRGLQRAKDNGFRDLESTGYEHVAMVYFRQKDPRAFDYFDRVLKLTQAQKDRRKEGIALSNLGAAYADVDRERALQYYTLALAAHREVGDTLSEASTLTGLADSYSASGKLKEAADLYSRALRVFRQRRDRERSAKTLGLLMSVWKAMGQPRVAIFYGKQGINEIQETRRNVSRIDEQFRKSYLSQVAPAYRLLADLLIEEGQFAQADRVLSLLKQDELSDFVRRDPTEIAKLDQRFALNENEKALLARYSLLADRITQIGDEFVRLDDKKRTLSRNELSLSEAETKRYQELEKQLADANAAFQLFVTKELVNEVGKQKKAEIEVDRSLQDKLRRWGGGTVALNTIAGPDRYRVVLTTPAIQVDGKTEIKVGDLNKKIFEFRAALQNPKTDPRPLGKELYEILVKPVEAHLRAAGAKTLLWSLDGSLRYLPMAALSPDGRSYLTESYQNVVLTDKTRDDLSGSAAAWRALGVGVSESQTVNQGSSPISFSALPGAEKELKTIVREEKLKTETGVLPGRRLVNAAFNVASFKDAVAKEGPKGDRAYNVLHIASHFRLGGSSADSFLLLGNGETLTLDEINNSPSLTFGGAELVTLSACNTAMGDDSGGREVESLASVIQTKSAKAILATLWPVADESTQLLMGEFYLAKKLNPKLTKAAAMQMAQRSMLIGKLKPSGKPTACRADDFAAGGGKKDEFKCDPNAPYSHPYFWSPFVLIGNWR